MSAQTGSTDSGGGEGEFREASKIEESTRRFFNQSRKQEIPSRPIPEQALLQGRSDLGEDRRPFKLLQSQCRECPGPCGDGRSEIFGGVGCAGCGIPRAS